MKWRNQSPDPHEAVTEEELSAFADGELPRGRARKVAAGLRREPAHADRVHAYWLREAALWRAYGSATTVPTLSLQSGVRSGRFGQGIATGTLLAASIAALVWWHAPTPPPPTQEAPFNLTQAIVQAFSNPVALAGNTNMPTLPFDQLGLSPSGQQPLQVSDRHILEYRFENAEGRRVALYEVERGGGDQWLHVLKRAPVTLVRWSQDGRGYVLAGDGSPLEMTRLALGMHDAMAMGASTPPPGTGQPSGAPPMEMEGAPGGDISEM